jgi:hypothetical protein
MLLLIAPPMGHAASPNRFVPDFQVRPDDYTILMAVDGQLSDGLTAYQPASHGKFYVEGWKHNRQIATWRVTVPAAADYAVRVSLSCRSAGPLRIEVSAGHSWASAVYKANGGRWMRQELNGLLHLPAGVQEITLRLISNAGAGDFDARVQSVELVQPLVRRNLHEAALKLRADTRWFQQAKYGFMFTWTSQTFPRQGDPKPYADAVRDFNVEALADQVHQAGAGFVVMATSHAFQYFPAPIQALDNILPGRTSQRDLVADLADALTKRGIRLMLYYHLGASDDPEWLNACGFWETDTHKFFGNWQSIIGEAGRRYGKKLAGWWFDDGAISYYYRNAPWEQLTRTAKEGNPQRLVGYNSWVLPSATEFQDFHCGENDADPTGAGALAVGGNGRYTAGPYLGLQAAATLVTESDWGHFAKDSPIANPRWSAPAMAGILRNFSARSNVPIFNLEIYQDGTLSPASIAMFHAARNILTRQD